MKLKELLALILYRERIVMGAGKTTFYACRQNLPSGSVGPLMAQLQKAISVSGGVKVLIGQLGMTTISALIPRRNRTFQIH
jgi:hypothetical protein